MRHLTKRPWLLLLLAVAAALGLVLFGKWREVSNRGGQRPAEPFRIAGNLYYVGANDVTSYLLTGPGGHVLIDGGYPGTPPLILASIAQLGFDVRDVEILLNTHRHLDHAGGLRALQEASGAELWVSDAEAAAVASGGAGGGFMGPFWFVSYLPIVRYPAPRVDRRFGDGATIRLGPIELTAHLTPGHTPGCTSWSIPVLEGDRELLAVLVCGLTPPLGLSLGETAEIRSAYERTFETLRRLSADIFLAPHARHFGRWRKFQASLEAADPVEPFVDPEGYRRYIDDAEARVHAVVAD